MALLSSVSSLSLACNLEDLSSSINLIVFERSFTKLDCSSLLAFKADISFVPFIPYWSLSVFSSCLSIAPVIPKPSWAKPATPAPTKAPPSAPQGPKAAPPLAPSMAPAIKGTKDLASECIPEV